MPLVPQITLHAFNKYAIYFVGLINPRGKRTGARDIITMIEYLDRWVGATLVKDCTVAAAAKFLFDNVVNRFGCPKILISDQGTHFVSQLIDELTMKL